MRRAHRRAHRALWLVLVPVLLAAGYAAMTMKAAPPIEAAAPIPALPEEAR